MLKRDSIIKKIASYSAFASCALGVGEVHAQILYHKLTPYDTLPPRTSDYGAYTLDLNGDGIGDFLVSTKSFANLNASSSKFYFNAKLNPESMNDRADQTNSAIGVLRSGQSIGRNGNWKDSQGNFVLFDIESKSETYSFIKEGNWKNQLDKFVGFRIRNRTTGDFNFGWMRLSVEFFKSNFDVYDNTAYVVVKDYAYEETPNKPIIAGDAGNCSPAVSLIVNGHKTFPIGDSAVLNVLGFRKGDAVTWMRNGEIIKTDSDKSLIVKEHGLYSALVENKTGCGQVTDSVQIKTYIPKNPPSVADQKSTTYSEIYVYNKTLFGRLVSYQPEKASIIIYNELGEEVIRQNIETNNFTIALQPFTTGIYFAQIINGGQMEVAKIFVE